MLERSTPYEGDAEAASPVPKAGEAGGFLAGVRDCLPVVLGYLAIGLAFGVVARTAGLSVLEVTLMSLILYAGSAQFIAVGLIATGAPALATVVTVALVNIRHLLYSAALAPHLHRGSPWKNLLVGLELTDETFALIVGRLGRGRNANHAWLYGINVTAQASWVGATTLGALLGQAVSNVTVLGLDFALPAMFAALLVLQIANRPRLRIAATVAVVGALVAVGGGLVVSGSWAVIAATVVAATLGVALEEKSA
jgi:4-azaleucine resistance transporter AzlC